MNPSIAELKGASDALIRDKARRGEIGLISRARRQNAGVDTSQLYGIEGRQLRILAAGNGATSDDIGKFWFVPGYSRVGGPDIVPIS